MKGKKGFQKGHKLNVGNTYAKGNKHSDEWKLAASERMKGNTYGFKKGKPSPRKGKPATKPVWNKGKKLPQFSGENHPNYIKDRSKVKVSEKKHEDTRYKEWMKAVKNRDGWKCKIGNEDCAGRIEAHHIVPWRSDKKLRYEVNNGITLCKFHHPLKEKDEIKMMPYFFELIDSNVPYSVI